ncbi:MAG: DUF4249 domain-containing protein [Bacteroidales bacterium]|nr:DUF4249 domain-containing protein [Bacteroidales bacterium]MDD3702241.1 DUF4249 domain-containing protein [Bacteroidales bacterium]MDY0368884.1 DUF4249 domain-containing protein [Bacteroidales bacterium]
MKKCMYIFSLISLLLLASCDSMISEVEIDPGQPKLVVVSYLSPEVDTITLQLTRSLPLYSIRNYDDWDNEPVPDALVQISYGQETVKLSYDPIKKRYWTTDLIVKKGRSYELFIRTSTGEEVSSSCTIPSKEPPEIEIISIIRPFPSENFRILNLRFRDYDGEGDYYRMTVGQLNIYGYHPDEKYIDKIYMQTGEEFVSDKGYDGEYFTYKTHQFYVWDQATLLLYLAITDVHYYSYHQSIYNFAGDNPFAEPTPVYSNIEGGLGVFAGFSIVEVELNF